MIGGAERTTPPDRLAGLEVAITGRLASMTREEAVRRLRAAGARYVVAPRAGTDLLVFGQGGPPLGDDGRLTKSLRRARELQGAGEGLRVAPEEELLALLGLEDPTAGRLYTTEQLGRILGVPRARLLAWVRAGLIRPTRAHHRLLLFDFRQVASARALVQLSEKGVSAARLRRSLEQLGAWTDRPEAVLAQLEALEHGVLGVRTPEGQVVEPSGQLRLDFEVAPARAAASLPAEREGPDDDPHFAAAVAAEERGDLHAAVVAYRKVLDGLRGGGRPRPEVAFNLGNVLYQLGRREDALEAYHIACELDAEFVEAWNNLGNLLHELGRYPKALEAYRRALEVEPDYADAHYNLAGTLAALGDAAGACRHWRSYLAQDPVSPTADEVRRRIRELEHPAR